MQALLAAIHTTLTTNATITMAFPGGSRLGLMPENTSVFPYATYQIIASPTVQGYTKPMYTAVTVQFTAWANSSTGAVAAAESLMGVLDTAGLGLPANYTFLRKSEPLPRMDAKLPNGDDAWGASLDYEFDTE